MQHRHHNSTQRRGSVLILVLVVVAMLTLGAYSFSEVMLSESEATSMYGRQAEARVFADSGVELAAAILGYPEGDQDVNTYHNPSRYQGIIMRDSDDARGRGLFSVVAGVESDSAGQTMRFGLMDESGKLNINHLLQFELDEYESRELLMYLPNMTEDVADAILDWVDDDDDPRELGAEIDYYSTLDPPYEPKNGPFESIEELLQVAGVTADLLYGEDTNRNGLLDPNENDGDASAPFDNADGVLQPGWASFLTVSSRELNLRSDGTEKIHVNNGVLTDLYDQLAEEFDETVATYVVAMRMNGPLSDEEDDTTGSSSSSSTGGTSSGGSGSTGGSSGSSGNSNSGNSGGNSSGNSGGATSGGNTSANSGGSSQTDAVLTGVRLFGETLGGGPEGTVTRGGMNLTAGAKYELKSLYELIGSQTQADFGNGMETLDSPWSGDPASLQENLPLLFDMLSVTDDTEIVGRINVNQARAETLMGLPNMTQEMALAIAGASVMAADGETVTNELNLRSTTGWLVTQGIVDLPTMVELDRFLTARGSVYRVQVVGFFEDGGGYSRIEAILDATEAPVKVLSVSDLTELGRGYPRDVLAGVSASATE